MARIHIQRKTALIPSAATGRRFPGPVRQPFALFVAALAMLMLCSCQSPDPVAKEKARTLTPDERYLVDYYMKIIEFEKHLHDNSASRDEKREELERSFDGERIRRTLAELEKKPERWLAIYDRINELQLRSLQNQPTEQY
ncbi:MAG: hypothetical protein PHD74_01675 [Candidatus Krumholzibacteria bacterium]|nr:hypothetical protein [Candidatus Krumholzibacteria bacterium]